MDWWTINYIAWVPINYFLLVGAVSSRLYLHGNLLPLHDWMGFSVTGISCQVRKISLYHRLNHLKCHQWISIMTHLSSSWALGHMGCLITTRITCQSSPRSAWYTRKLNFLGNKQHISAEVLFVSPSLPTKYKTQALRRKYAVIIRTSNTVLW